MFNLLSISLSNSCKYAKDIEKKALLSISNKIYGPSSPLLNTKAIENSIYFRFQTVCNLCKLTIFFSKVNVEYIKYVFVGRLDVKC